MARALDPFAPADRGYAGEDGTFGNRFDDPRVEHGVPEEERFRVIYCAGSGETIARFRPDLESLAKLEEIVDEPIGFEL